MSVDRDLRLTQPKSQLGRPREYGLRKEDGTVLSASEEFKHTAISKYLKLLANLRPNVQVVLM